MVSQSSNDSVELGIEAVAAGENVVDFLLRHQIPAGRKRTVVQKRDGIFAVLVFQAEQVAHGFNGNKNAGVGAIVAFLPDFSEHADDFKTNVIEQDGRADGGASGEDVLQQFPADDGHAAGFGVVLIVEPAAGTYGNIADLVVLGCDAEDLSAGRTVIADGADVFAVEHGGKIFERARLAADGEVILVGEMVGASGLGAAFDGGRAAGEGEHDVLAEIL